MLERLTEREKKILLLMCEGVRTVEIARQMGVTTHTIMSAWGRIQDKTGFDFIGPLCARLRKDGYIVTS